MWHKERDTLAIIHTTKQLWKEQMKISVRMDRKLSMEEKRLVLDFVKFSLTNLLNPRTYKQSHTPTVVQGGGLMEPPLGFSLCYNLLKRFHLM